VGKEKITRRKNLVCLWRDSVNLVQGNIGIVRDTQQDGFNGYYDSVACLNRTLNVRIWKEKACDIEDDS
jgi:hypothetical protein